MDGGFVEGLLKLIDDWSPTLAVARKNTNEFITSNKESFKAVGEAVAGFSALVVGAGAAIVAMGSHGADVNDVREQFKALQENLGNTGDVLGGLRSAFAGTVSDFDLMKSVNLSVGQGLKATQADLELTARAARVLSDRTGGDAKEAFESLNQAMATGIDRGLKTVGLNIDGAAAVEAYAAKVGVQVSKLTEAQQVEAKREAILQQLRSTLALTGDAQLDFADRVAQAKTAFSNFMDDVSAGIANSDALAAGMEEVSNQIKLAFGDDKGQLVKNVVHLVEDFVIWVLKAGQAGVEVARFISNAWDGLNFLFNKIMEGLTDALSFLNRAIASTIESAAAIPGAPDFLKDWAKTARAASDETQIMSHSFHQQAEEALDNAAAHNAMADKVSSAFGAIIKATEDAQKNQKETSESTKKLTRDLGDQGGAVKGLSQEWLKLVEAYKKAHTEAGQQAEAQKALKVALLALGDLSKTSLRDLSEGVKVLSAMGDAGRGAAKDLEALWGAANKVAVLPIGKNLGGLKAPEFGSMSQQGGDNTEDFVRQAREAAAAFTKEFQDEAKKRQVLFSMFGDLPEEQFRAVAKKLGVSLGEEVGKQGGKEAAKTFGQTFRAAMAGLPQVILGAIQGGGGVFAAVSSHIAGQVFGADSNLVKGATKFLTDHLGEKLGGALGSMIPGIGAALGPAIGGLVDKVFGGLFGGEGKKVNDMRDEFLQQFGGWEELAKQLAEAGDSGLMRRIFDADTVNEFNNATKEATDLLQKHKDQMALDKEANDALTAAMQKYGIEAGQLGPKFAKSRLDADMAAWMQDWRLLTAAGADHKALLEAMGPDLSELVQQYMEAGVAIPEAMRPVLEEAAANGQLLDANGKQITDLAEAGITFAQSMDDMFTTLMEKVDKLINALLGIDDVNVTPKINLPDAPSRRQGRFDPESFAEGSGGLRDFGSGTPAMLHGTEGVFTAGNLQDLAVMMAQVIAPALQGGGMVAGRLAVDLTTGLGDLVAQKIDNDEGGVQAAIRRAMRS